MQRVLGYMRKAIQEFDLIQDGDRIAVGISGGKDSVALLVGLARLRRFIGIDYSLTAITLDPQFHGAPGDYSAIGKICEELEIPYVVKKTQIGEIVFDARQDTNPCSLCARMRRGALHKAALEAGCSTVALGHHQRDAAETFMMNLLDGGTLGCFSPKSYLDRRGITLIRPMIFMEEREIAAYCVRRGLPVVKSRCPVDGCTNRQRTGELLEKLAEQYGPLEEKILGAMQKAGLDGW